MVGGLRTTTAAASGGGAVHTMTMADGGTSPAAVSTAQQMNSKFDDLLQGTGWTREDVELVLQTISTALLLMWLFSEVLNG